MATSMARFAGHRQLGPRNSSSTRAGERGGGESTHSSPDSLVLPLPPTCPSFGPAAAFAAAGLSVWSGAQQAGDDEELLDLWDAIWFGVGSLPGTPTALRPPKMMVDPLARMPLPDIEVPGQPPPYARRPPTVQQELERQLERQQREQRGRPQPDGGSPEAAPSLRAPNGRLASAHAGSFARQQAPPSLSSNAVAPGQQQQQWSVQNQVLSQGEDERQQQEATGPAPYVLGTWTQRQFIMPLGRTQQQPKQQQQQQQQQNAGGASTAEQPPPLPGTSAAQPIRWPSGGSGGSGGSRGSGGRAAAAADRQEPCAADERAGMRHVHGSNAAAMAGAAAPRASEDGAGSAGARSGRRSVGTDEEEEAVVQAAWRWRFAKRWQAEQTRAPLDPAASVGDGGMEEALQYLAACGENWHLARATSAEVAASNAESRLLGTLGTPSLLGAELLVGEGSYPETASSRGGGLLQSTGSGGIGGGALSREASASGRAGRANSHGEATQQVTGITKRAAQLLAAQSDINKAATQRWREVQTAQAGDAWVGALLESVEVDDWGKFKWLLLRLRDRSGRQQLLVRGANYASDAKIVEGLHRQMMAACGASGACAEPIEVVGGGVMEWRRHRDRHLHISGGYVSPGVAGGPSTAVEVMNLGAVLTKQHLPMHYRVTSEGGKAL